MPWLRHLALLVAFVAALVRPAPASAFTPACPETRGGGFEVAAQLLAGELGAASLEQHQGIGAAYDENASGYRFAAGGGPKVGSAGGPGAGKRFAETTKDAAETQAGGQCVFCGRETTRTPGGTQRNTDHAIPKSRSGNNTLDNAQNTCRDCNLDKGTQTTQEYLDRLRQGGGG